MAWDWLQSGPGSRDPIDDALLIADHIDNLPQTAAAFRPGDVGINNTDKLESLLVLNDSWFIPGHLSGGADTKKAINPKYRFIEHYAEAPVRCRCGAVISMENEWYENEHGKCNLEGNCNSLWSAQARADLWQKRYDILVQSAELLRSPKYVSERIGCEPGTLSYISKRLHISREDILEESRKELSDYVSTLKGTYTAEELSRIFNRSPSTIRRWW